LNKGRDSRQISRRQAGDYYLPIKSKIPARIARTAKIIDIGLGKGTSTLMP